ncbi:MAG: ABC transporter permease [archaeon]
MEKIIRIVKKDYKLLVRSRTSALIVIFGPLLIIFLVGLAFGNANRYSIRVGVFSEEYSDLTESFIERLGSEGLSIMRYESEESCISKVMLGDTHICVVFPAQLQIAETEKEITFHVDYSKINLVWMVIDEISSKVSDKSSELSLNLTTSLLNRLSDTQAEIRRDQGLMEMLKAENINMTARLSEVRRNLTSIQLAFSETPFRLEQFEDNTRASMNDIRNLSKVISQTANLGISYADSAMEEMEFVNASAAERSIAVNLVSSVRDKCDDIKKTAADIGNATEDDLDDFRTSLIVIRTQINNIQVRFRGMDSTRSLSIARLDAVLDDLNRSLGLMGDIGSSFDTIDENIESIRVGDAAKIVSPVATRIKPISSEKSHLDYLLPSLIVLVIMFTSMLLSSILIVMEKRSPAYIRNFITPTRDIVFFLATYTTTILLILVQALVIILISAIFFSASILPSLFSSMAIIFLLASFFAFLGIILGSVFESEEIAALGAISTGCVFLFLSGVILPVESMSSFLGTAASVNPFVISEFLLRSTILFRTSLSDVSGELLLLIVYCIIVMVAAYAAQKIIRKQYLFKYARRISGMKKKQG